MARKIYYELLDLNKIATVALNHWYWVLISVAILLAGNLIAAYFVTDTIPLTLQLANPASTSAPKSAESELGLLNAIFKVHEIANNSVGSGFLVSPDYVITASHVARDVGNKVELTNSRGFSASGFVVASGWDEFNKIYEMHRSDPEYTYDASAMAQHDWAFIELNNPIMEIKPLKCGQNKDVVQTREVFLVGYPGGADLATPKGVITKSTQSAISTDTELDKGQSGGPMMLADNGQITNASLVVGVNVLVHPEAHTSKTAVHIDILRRKAKELLDLNI